jgi:hypothetical protein
MSGDNITTHSSSTAAAAAAAEYIQTDGLLKV